MIPLAILVAAAAALPWIESPPFTVRHSPTLEREAARIAATLPETVDRIALFLESPPLPPSNLYLIGSPASDRNEAGPGRLLEEMPEWAAGIAVPSLRTIVVRADRVGTYGQRRIQGVVEHEIAHLVMAEAAAGAMMPRWFREGVAGNLARDGEWLDFLYLWLSSIGRSHSPLSTVEASFAVDDMGRRRVAYAGAFSFVAFAMRRHSDRLPARVLEGLRHGLDFETAWARATGTSLYLDASDWAASSRGARRWAAILTSSFTLWAAITMLFLMAWRAKRRRARRTMERWDEEDDLFS